MNDNIITIVTDYFYDYDTDSFIPRGSCNLLLEICKYIKRKHKIKFKIIQMSNSSYKKYKYPFNIVGIKTDNLNIFKKILSSMKLTNVHYNNIDLMTTLNVKTHCTATIHTNAYLNTQIPNSTYLKKIFVVNNKYLTTNNSKICLIKNGVDCNFFSYKKIKKYDNEIIFFFPNIPNKNKNLDFALDLITCLNKTKTKYKFKLYVAGMTGNIDNYVFGLGFLTKHEMKKYYKNSHFSIIPSFSESCSLCMLESMACGTIPFVNDTFGMQEYIKNNETGFAISITNKNEWINKILSLLSDKDLFNQIRNNGSSFVKNNYNLKVTAESYYREWSKVFKLNNL